MTHRRIVLLSFFFCFSLGLLLITHNFLLTPPKTRVPEDSVKEVYIRAPSCSECPEPSPCASLTTLPSQKIEPRTTQSRSSSEPKSEGGVEKNVTTYYKTLLPESYYDANSPLVKYKNGEIHSIDWSNLKPNIVGNDTVWVFVAQDLLNTYHSHFILLNSSRHFKFHVNILGIGAERYAQWGFGLKCLWSYRAVHAPIIKPTDFILAVDAWDAFFTTNLTELMSLYYQHYSEYDIVLGNDVDLFPWQLKTAGVPECFEPYQSRTYAYVNSGFRLTRAAALKTVLSHNRPYWGTELTEHSDQGYWNLVVANYRMQDYADKHNGELSPLLKACKTNLLKNRPRDVVQAPHRLPSMTIDHKSILSVAIGHTYHHVVWRGGRVLNLFTGTRPAFVHYNWKYDKELSYDFPLYMSNLNNTMQLDVTQYINTERTRGVATEYFYIKNKFSNKYVWDNAKFLDHEVLDNMQEQYKKNNPTTLIANATESDERSIFTLLRQHPDTDNVHIINVKNLRYVGRSLIEPGKVKLGSTDWIRFWDLKSESWMMERRQDEWWKIRENSIQRDLTTRHLKTKKRLKGMDSEERRWLVSGDEQQGEVELGSASDEARELWMLEGVEFDLVNYTRRGFESGPKELTL